LQVKLCDPRLSALSVVATIKALYKYILSFPFLKPYSINQSINWYNEKCITFTYKASMPAMPQHCWFGIMKSI